MLIPASPSRDAAKKYVPKQRDITSRDLERLREQQPKKHSAPR